MVKGLRVRLSPSVKKELIVATAEGALSLKQVQPAGKPKMDIASFLNGVGRTLAVGERFGD